MNSLQQNVILKSLTSWLIGGPAEYYVQPTSIDEVVEAQRWAQQKSLPVTVLGGGSNVLISDQGIRGLVIGLKSLAQIEVAATPERLNLICLSGTSKSELLKIFLKYQLPPALFLAGLPGDVGGGIVMNAGVSENFRPREFVELTDWIEVLQPNGQIKRILATELQWRYRHCDGWQPGIILRAGLSWPLADKDFQILDKVRAANKIRLSKQPLDLPSCGSVFKNPEGHKSAQLIDQVGLKGFRIGDAQVSTKHANFIVNLGAATATDTWAVIEHVREFVLQKTGVNLSTEVVRLGEW